MRSSGWARWAPVPIVLLLVVLLAGGAYRDGTSGPGRGGAALAVLDAHDPQSVGAAPAPSPEVSVVVTRAGVVVPVLERVGNGFRVSTPCGREAVVTGAVPLGHATVVIDPGHGGYDPGAVGPNGLREADLNLAVSLEAKAALEAEGVSVVLTRSADHGMNLANRARLATALGAAVFVSVHHNAAATAPSALPGTETYYQQGSDESRRLAGLAYEEVVEALSAHPVRWVGNGAGATWRSRARDGDDYYAVVRLPKPVPAALVEFAYLSNPAEADFLAQPATARLEGEALARAVVRFLRTDDPGSGYVEGGQVAPRPRTGGGGGGGGVDPCDDPEL